MVHAKICVSTFDWIGAQNSRYFWSRGASNYTARSCSITFAWSTKGYIWRNVKCHGQCPSISLLRMFGLIILGSLCYVAAIYISIDSNTKRIYFLSTQEVGQVSTSFKPILFEISKELHLIVRNLWLTDWSRYYICEMKRNSRNRISWEDARAFIVTISAMGFHSLLR